MKKILIVILIIALVVGLVFVIDNIIPRDEYYLRYTIDEVNKTCIITEGYLYEGYNEICIPETIEGYRVVGIGKEAFKNCKGLWKITIPDSVTSIGDSAFYGRDTLTYNQYDNAYYLGNNNNPYKVLVKTTSKDVTTCTIHEATKIILSEAFSDCTELTSIVIPNNVTNIGNSTFSGCSNLMSVTIPDSVASIGKYTFYGCSNLTNITIPDSVTSIGEEAFKGCNNLTNVTIGNGVKSIGDATFADCSSLTSLTIGNGVKSIGWKAFEGCKQLTGVYITDLAKWCEISFSFSFYENDNSNFANPLYYAKKLYLNGELITNLVIPEGVSRIGEGTFCNCENITSITIPDSVTSIGRDAFAGCKNLIQKQNGISYIGEFSWDRGGWLIDCDASVVTVSLPSNVVGFGDYAFKDCSALTDISLPSDLLHISEGAFYNCTNLTSVGYPIPSKITSIGACAFQRCNKLYGMYIPNSVTKFGDFAYDSPYLERISFGGTVAEWNAIDDFGYEWWREGGEIQCSNGVALATSGNRYMENTTDEETTTADGKVYGWIKSTSIFDIFDKG